MNKRTLLISDYSLTECPLGGTELTDTILIEQLGADFIKSSFFTNGAGYDKIIVSNAWELNPIGREWLESNGFDFKIEHDFQLFAHRIPDGYPDFKAPESELRNVKLYKAAKRVIFQSSYQKNIFDLNIKLNKTYNLEGNIWRDDELDFFENTPSTKNGRCAILRGRSFSKGFAQAVEIADSLRLKVDVLDNMPYSDFIRELSKYSNVLLYPLRSESFGRVAAEASMMGVAVLTNKFMACTAAPWWESNRFEIVRYMRNCKKNLFNLLSEN